MLSRYPLLLIFILGVSLYSCYEYEEACLDTFATNFSISADDACESCCIYPSVNLLISHAIGDARFSRDSVTFTNFGDSVRINKAIVFLGDFELFTTDGDVLEVSTTTLYRNAEGKEAEQKEDNVVIIDNSSLSSIGQIRELGTVDSLAFNVGVSFDGVSLEDESALNNYDSLYVNDEYYDVLLYISTGELLVQDISLRLKIENGTDNIGFGISNVVKALREDIGFQLKIDYKILLNLIDFDATIDEQIFAIPYPEGFLTITI